jgi:hypothetical protein
MVQSSSAASTMARRVAEKFDLQWNRDRELIRWLAALYIAQGYQIPPDPLWRMNQRRHELNFIARQIKFIGARCLL